jgi:hypothetical protein
MPWDIILTALGSSSLTAVIITVLGLTLAQRVIEQGIAGATRRMESSLIQAEEAYKSAIELNAQIDIHLREQRIKVYATIWKETGIVPRWPRATNVAYADILRFSEALRAWYFGEQGGMWLSSEARKAYGNLQETNTTILTQHTEGPLAPDDYEAILAKCSALRTELTNDLVSRRAAPANI